jgi:hypothetical protein
MVAWGHDNSCQKLPIVPRSREKLAKVVKNCKKFPKSWQMMAKVDKCCQMLE